MANKMRKDLPREEWDITLVDQYKTHYYQPGFLFIPFGMYREKDVVKPKGDFFPVGAKVVYSEVDQIDPDKSAWLEQFSGRRRPPNKVGLALRRDGGGPGAGPRALARDRRRSRQPGAHVQPLLLRARHPRPGEPGEPLRPEFRV